MTMKDNTPFYLTKAGKIYYEKQLPELIKSNNRLAEAQEQANILTAKLLKQENKRLQLERRKLLMETRLNKTNPKETDNE